MHLLRPTSRAQLCPLSASCTSVLWQPLSGSYHLPVRGQAPRARRWALLCSHNSCLHKCLFRGCAEPLPPTPGGCPRSRMVPVHTSPWASLTCVQVRWLPPLTGLSCLCRHLNYCTWMMSTTSFSLFVSSFAAMDGVPFMISEKFSCVPESVSFMHDFPSLPPPHPDSLCRGMQGSPDGPHSPSH